jgi:hypothetical protein
MILPKSRWLHKKGGGVYTVMHLGILESTHTLMVIYQGKDEVIWIRPYTEFNDRFELIQNPA